VADAGADVNHKHVVCPA